MRDLYYLDILGGSLLDLLEASFYKQDPIKSMDDKYTLRVELPGIKEKDLELTFYDGELKIKHYKGDNRQLYIGDNVDEDNISATLEDGILTVTFPKKNKSTVKTIKISKP